MSKCEYETSDGRCTLNECMYGDFLEMDDSRFDSGRYCMCDEVEKYREEKTKTYCESTHCQMYESAKRKIRADAIDDLIEIVGALESCCIDHEENEEGEWLTFTFDYEKWADMLNKLEQLKEQTE